LFVAGFCMMQVMMLTLPVYVAAPGEIAPDLLALLRWATWMLTLPVMLFSAGPFFGGAWRALRQRRIGMDVPVAIGIAVTFIAGTGVTFDPGGRFGTEPYLDSLTMFVTFLLAGRWLELRARARSTEALDALLLRMPDSVERIDADGATRTVATARLRVGDRIRVAAGQAFPGDGTLLEGRTQVDEAMLSGESHY
jgi:Cu2+-exporting ATPase